MESSKNKTAVIALFEITIVSLIYIVLAHWSVAIDLFGASRWFPEFSPAELDIAKGFFNGAISQAILVVILIALFPPARQAVATLWQPAFKSGWIISASVLVIEVVTLYLGWIGDFGKLFDTSYFGVSMSIVPALDGITQEIVFRGYVILRLADAGISRFGQIFMSGLLFALIHFSYGQSLDSISFSSLFSTLIPLIATFSLGSAWAFAFQESGYRLLPVTISHILVILLTQPWLAMIYSVG